MASTSFRDSLQQLGWSRRDADLPVRTSSTTPILAKIQSINPFGSNGYVRLPTDENPGAPLPARTRREEDEAWFAREYIPALFSSQGLILSIVSRWDRMLVFGGLNLGALALFVVCFTLLPILSLKPRKFAIL